MRLWDYNGWRYQVVLTNAEGADIAAVEAAHRGHAQVESRIKNLKDTGLARLPFADYTADRTWVARLHPPTNTTHSAADAPPGHLHDAHHPRNGNRDAASWRGRRRRSGG